MSRPAIDLEDVRKTYRLYSGAREMTLDALGLGAVLRRRGRQIQEFEALRGVTMTIGHGERWGIVGRNGAGKTTLLRLLTGNYAPTSGRVSVDGTIQALFSAGIGFHDEVSGIENVRSALAYNGLWGDRLERAVDDVVEFVELDDFLHHPIRTYSQGMSMRLQFATATAISPDILIIDEVLSAGDGYFAVKSAERVRALAESGCTLLLVSHSLEQIRSFCSKTVWLEGGRVEKTGPTEDVLRSYEGSFEREDAQKAAEANADRLSEGKRQRARLQTFELSESFRAPFVLERIRATEPIDVTAERPRRAPLDDGVEVERWAADPAVALAEVRLERGGQPVDRVRTGEPAQLSLRLRIQHGGQYALRYVVRLYASDGELVASAISPVDRFAGTAGEARRWRLELPQLTFGHGEYAASFGVFDVSRDDALDLGNRVDYLSRALAVRVPPTNDVDPPILHWPSTWRCGDRTPEPGRVSGVQ